LRSAHRKRRHNQTTSPRRDVFDNLP
jgi:hypothetical protein